MSTIKSLEFFLLFLEMSRSLNSFFVDAKISNEIDSRVSGFIDLSAFDRNAFIEPNNEITGKLVTTYNEAFPQNPEELGSYFEGDIFMREQFIGKNVLVGKSLRWPKNTVPYEIRGNFSANELSVIDWAFGEFHKKTCIRFKQWTTEKDFISIVNGETGCWSSAGRIGGKQEVNLQTPPCVKSRGTILHEFMHVLGFMHEHNRHDRDNYIIIHQENIKEDMMRSFKKLNKDQAHGMGVGYDYASVMHYSSKSFSKNGKPTIEPKKNTDEARLIGQRFGFSTADIAKVNKVFKCKATS